MSGRWKPKHGDRYWYINSQFFAAVDIYSRRHVDIGRYQLGNFFESKEDADAAAEKVKDLLLGMHEPTTNSSQPVTDCSQLPKLTTDVFNRSDCPEWAKYAGYTPDGCLAYFRNCPDLDNMPCLESISLKNSLIERPAKALPDWCKVDAMGWHKRCGYFKVTYIDEFSKHVDIQQVEDKSKGYLSFHTVCTEVVQARPRPYNEYEMEALVGKAIKTPDGNVYLCTAYQKPNDAYEAAVDVDTWISVSGLLEDGYTINNKPCGKLEHLNEKGEWVE